MRQTTRPPKLEMLQYQAALADLTRLIEDVVEQSYNSYIESGRHQPTKFARRYAITRSRSSFAHECAHVLLHAEHLDDRLQLPAYTQAVAYPPAVEAQASQLNRASLRRLTRALSPGIGQSAARVLRRYRDLVSNHAVVRHHEDPEPQEPPGRIVTSSRRPARGPNNPWTNSPLSVHGEPAHA